jgi:hypothetical protein
MSHQGTSSLTDSHIDLFRSLLEEHQSALVQRIASQQAQFSVDIDARIDAKINAHSAEFKSDMDSFRASMVSEVASCTQSAIENMMDQLSDRVSLAVKSEVESLDEKFQTLLDNSSSVHSGSHTSTLSACVSHSSAQSEQFTLGGCVPRRQKWQCPVCQVDLKHEKSFFDHLSLLMSRVHELPVARGRRCQKKLKKCIFNIERPEHTLLLQPWAATQPNFWCQAREFVRCLLLMLKPGSEYATRDDNPRHASVFRWIDECRTGVFKPSN